MLAVAVVEVVVNVVNVVVVVMNVVVVAMVLRLSELPTSRLPYVV